MFWFYKFGVNFIFILYVFFLFIEIELVYGGIYGEKGLLV